MKITVTTGSVTASITCSDCFIWDGVLKNAPDYIIDLVADGDAFVAKAKHLVINHVNGQCIADVGDMIYKQKQSYHVIRLDKNV